MGGNWPNHERGRRSSITNEAKRKRRKSILPASLGGVKKLQKRGPSTNNFSSTQKKGGSGGRQLMLVAREEVWPQPNRKDKDFGKGVLVSVEYSSGRKKEGKEQTPE